MRSERKKQVMTLSILVVAVLVISVGFAAFSSILRVSTSATVNPNASDFKVVFSSSPTALETNAIVANPSSLGGSATIDNTSVPTISGLDAKFTSPGESVSYTFYARNEGEYLAYLNSITFRDKTCTAEEGTTSSLVEAACDDITMTVTVGSVTTSETKLDITGETLDKDSSKEVTVTISYDSNGTTSDGPFTIEFGDVSLYYASVSGINESAESSVCMLTNDIDGDDVADNGDEVTCGSEVFYVVPNDTTAHSTATTGNVTLITKYNLDVGDIYAWSDEFPLAYMVGTISNPTGIQSSRALGLAGYNNEIYGTIAFSETNYWSTTVSDGTFVYNDQSLLYPHVENYGAYIRNMGVSVKQASLLSYVQLLEIKKLESAEGLYSNFTWTTFWLGSTSETYSGGSGGSSENFRSIYYANSDGTYYDEVYYDAGIRGVRPVIVIPESEIG